MYLFRGVNLYSWCYIRPFIYLFLIYLKYNCNISIPFHTSYIDYLLAICVSICDLLLLDLESTFALVNKQCRTAEAETNRLPVTVNSDTSTNYLDILTYEVLSE
ncbi:uncharacterized protein LAJ45_03928 [Morchella importuna]|uniref:uncharacterized protein n=1 Tax=Morchella importuna TaxID=1174673 RepID=UPI001E8E0387|nr:uncharacterized protein LAJ45_03928 [Morchella importuna]KAH8151935.1 hypothetical protein LAJ45_03928 [Morchella importuna]